MHRIPQTACEQMSMRISEMRPWTVPLIAIIEPKTIIASPAPGTDRNNKKTLLTYYLGKKCVGTIKSQ